MSELNSDASYKGEMPPKIVQITGKYLHISVPDCLPSMPLSTTMTGWYGWFLTHHIYIALL